jgi:hypothetical protein
LNYIPQENGILKGKKKDGLRDITIY